MWLILSRSSFFVLCQISVRRVVGKQSCRGLSLSQTRVSPSVCPTRSIDDTQVKDLKPFESIPGPKPLPFIGNLWRYAIGMKFFVLL